MKNKRFMSYTINSIFLVLGVLFLSSCARNLSSDVYVARNVGETSLTYSGVIRNARSVCVQEGEQLEENGLGIAGGGLAGGILGNAIGKGRFVPTAVGAIAGAVTGSFVEKRLKQQNAMEYVVQFDNGGMMTIVQGEDQPFCIGQPIYVIVSQSGRSRIIPQ